MDCGGEIETSAQDGQVLGSGEFRRERIDCLRELARNPFEEIWEPGKLVLESLELRAISFESLCREKGDVAQGCFHTYGQTNAADAFFAAPDHEYPVSDLGKRVLGPCHERQCNPPSFFDRPDDLERLRRLATVRDEYNNGPGPD